MIAQHRIETTRRPLVTRLVTHSKRRTAPTARSAVAAPAAFILIGSRIDGPDRLAVQIRIEHEGTLESAQETAQRLARHVSRHNLGAPSCADVTDLSGLPVYSFSVGGAAR